jgi:ABC-type multidrug transport system ATPase subunit/ABC-type transport system involved in multi-copper enzyme maturation permease subunit
MPDEAPAVVTHGLTKRFGHQTAVDGVDLEVPRGAIYGFLGPNGSGKTTTLRMLLGLVRPTAGAVRLFGSPMPERAARVLPRVGALVEGPAFHPYLSGRANLDRLDAVDATADPRTRGHRAAAALDRVGLGPAARKPYRQYSLGMKQRLGLAAALLRPRDLLVLDEPTNGLDPQGTREVRELLREVADRGATVVVSSHLLGEVEQVCTRVGVMSRGRLLVQGPPDRLADDGTTTVAVTTTPACLDRAARLLEDLGVGTPRRDGATLIAPLGLARPEKISAAMVAAGLDLLGLEVRRPSLETVFVELTGRDSMSRAEAVPVADTRPAPRGAAGRLLRSELRLVLGRRRNLVLLAGLAAVPVIIGTVLAVTRDAPVSGGPPFLDRVTGNGLFLVVTALIMCLPLLLPLVIGIVAGDSIAGEAQAGTLRYLLLVPVGRTRLLVAKAAAVAVYVGCAVAVVALSGLVTGAAYFGVGDVTLLSGGTVPAAEGLLRAAGVVAYVGLSLTGLAAVGLFVSTLTEVPVAAMAATVVVSIVSNVLDALPQLSAIHPALLTHHWLDFGELLRAQVDLGVLGEGLAVQAAWVAIFGSLAWSRFTTADVTS